MTEPVVYISLILYFLQLTSGSQHLSTRELMWSTVEGGQKANNVSSSVISQDLGTASTELWSKNSTTTYLDILYLLWICLLLQVTGHVGAIVSIEDLHLRGPGLRGSITLQRLVNCLTRHCYVHGDTHGQWNRRENQSFIHHPPNQK